MSRNSNYFRHWHELADLPNDDDDEKKKNEGSIGEIQRSKRALCAFAYSNAGRLEVFYMKGDKMYS